MNLGTAPSIRESTVIPISAAADRLSDGQVFDDRRAVVSVRDVTHPSDRMHALDGLRGVAIGLVMLFHVRTLGGGQFAGKWSLLLDPIAARGQFGVELFFVLSGFLITMLLLREEREHGRVSLGRFYFRRAFRILPPAFVYLGFVAILALIGTSAASSDLLTSAFFVRNFFHGGSSDTGHFWTLAIEEQFYLAWPLAMVMLPRNRRSIVVIGLLAALGIFRHEFHRFFPHSTSTAFEFHYDGLLVGSLLALLRDSVAWRGILDRRWIRGDLGLLLGITAIALLLSPLADRFGKYHELLVPGLLCGCVALTINAVLPRKSVRSSSPGVRVLTSTPLVAIGLISYSLYLWQQLFCVMQSSLVVAMPWCLLIAVAASVISFFAVERPSLVLRRRCSTWFAARANRS